MEKRRRADPSIAVEKWWCTNAPISMEEWRSANAPIALEEVA
jgi:hypothetical protein